MLTPTIKTRVMGARHRSLLLWALTAMLMTGCASTPVDDSEAILFVNDEKITERDYASFVAMGKIANPPQPDRSRADNLSVLIDRILLTQRSIELKMDRTDAVRRSLDQCRGTSPVPGQEAETGLDPVAHMLLRTRRCRENVLIREFVHNLARDMHFTEAEMREQLQQRIERAHKYEYKSRHIMLATEAEARRVKDRLKSGKSFEEVAKAYSIDRKSAENGGDIGWIRQAWVTDGYFQALLALKKGQVSGPVRSEFGWHVIRLDDVRPMTFPTFEEFMAHANSKDQLIKAMQDERLDNILKELRSRAKIVILPRARPEEPPPRRKYINSRVSDPIYRSYLQGWRRQVEERGNALLPEELRKKQITGSVLVSVDIRADGYCAEIEIRRSSGHPALDEAAKHIAMQAAPFTPLPPEILKDTDILNITATWKFASRNGPELE